eukprot:TRINITY_DN62881_c0_g1_i1.p1 TRINITY_DN62881_c0_g1~~TRINITY_DN62881_c0_g1_i1.p1  ORF type:complete len:276 (-),score=42.29 TRINITY_DN62881_c0_g1_i1:544-1371(-)
MELLQLGMRRSSSNESVWCPTSDLPSSLEFEFEFESELEKERFDSDTQSEDHGVNKSESWAPPPSEMSRKSSDDRRTECRLEEGTPSNESDVPSEWQGKMSVMVRNLPYKCTPSMFFDELCQAGFENLVDYIYVPVNYKGMTCKGYAFANFVDSSSAYDFFCRFNARKMNIPGSKKLLEVTPAFLQGYDQNSSNITHANKRVNAGVVLDSRKAPSIRAAKTSGRKVSRARLNGPLLLTSPPSGSQQYPSSRNFEREHVGHGLSTERLFPNVAISV